MLLASLTPFLYFTVFVLHCLCFCVFNVSFVSPKSTLGQQFAHMALAASLASSAVPRELHLQSHGSEAQGAPEPFCHGATVGQGPFRGTMVPTGGCVRGAGAAAPLGAARHRDTIHLLMCLHGSVTHS